ncbi:MAG: biotin-dependent carboxyltransferase family protein [Flavobacteriaceae bacterium]
MLEIIRAGLFDTIQDLGRFGLRSLGVAVSGAMHKKAFAQANARLGNHPNDAALEIGQIGGVYRFHTPTIFTLSGAAKEARLNGLALSSGPVHRAKAGDELFIGRSTEGVYTYMAVKGGFQTECILNSRSMHPSLFEHPRLQKGQQLAYDSHEHFEPNSFSETPLDGAGEEFVLEAQRGPEFHFLLQPNLIAQLKFKVADFNRMGYRLLPSTHLKKSTESISSCAVFPGIVQLTPSGECIVLHRDAQVSGGYPRILVLSDESLDRLAGCSRDQSVKLLLR